MANFRLRQFSDAAVLREIRVDRLVEFLGRHRAHFEQLGINLCGPGQGDLDYERIARALLDTDETTPRALIDDLYFVDEMATEEGMDQLVAAVSDLSEEEQGAIGLGADPTPADVAVAVRLRAPSILERKHAERFVTTKRSFYYFRPAKRPHQPYVTPSNSQLAALEDSLANGFEALKRSRAVKVFLFEKTDAVWILVRRGEPCKREAAVDPAGEGSVFYRPAVYDVLRYDLSSGELSASAGSSKKILELHRLAFGRHLFNDEAYFADRKNLFTLDPLQVSGPESLACGDVEGLESVVLRELRVLWGGPENEVEIRKATDLFRAFERRNRSIPATARIVSAKFAMTFGDSKTARSVTISSSNTTSFTRDSDSPLVEEWMVKRGFTVADDDALA